MPSPQPSSLRQSTAPASAGNLRALYVHIPFCHSICPFCAFAVHGNRPQLHQAFVDALLCEIARSEAVADPGAITSIYIGGGTPSTLAPSHLQRILEALTDRFHPAAGAEVAIEVNPEDGKGAYFKAVRELGVTRVSLGVQSLEDGTLQALGRGHSAAQAEAAIGAALDAGFNNLNVDLMFGAPHIEPAAFRRDVARVAALRPAHVSLYGLDIEEHTLFGRDPRIRAWSAAHREEQAEQYLFAVEALEAAGYVHYEVSNFCQPRREGRQNLLVWGGAEYAGFGPGAHSWLQGVRRANERHLPAYERRIATTGHAVAFEEHIDPVQAANERLMLELRQRSGLNVSAWSERHAVPWDAARAQISSELLERGLAKWDGTRLSLTRRGMLLADEITERLMVPIPPEGAAHRPR